MALKHDGQWYLEIAEAAEMERITRQETYKRVQEYRLLSIDRRPIDAKRGTLIPARGLSYDGQKRWQERLLKQLVSPDAMARQAQPVISPESKNSGLSPLDFPARAALASVSTPEQLTLAPPSEIDVVIRAMPEGEFKKQALARYRAVRMLLNHDGFALGRNRTEQAKVIAAQFRVSEKQVWEWRKKLASTIKSEDDPGDPGVLMRQRPGPPASGPGGIVFPKLDPSLRTFITECWEIRRLSRNQSVEAVKGYLSEKQRGCGPGYLYDELSPTFPLQSTICRFINERLDGDQNAARNGAGAVKVAAGYIDRHYNDQFAGDAWCIDEWEIDSYPYDDRDHRIVFNYGRKNPILHLLSAIDERSTKILDWILTVRVDEDSQVLAERMLRKFWLPLRLVADRASRFRELAHGRVVTRKTGEVVELLEGSLGLLGVKGRGSEEKNPRGNRIERMHGIYAPNARRDFGLSWRPPQKVRGFAGVDLREATGIDQRVTRHYSEHCRKGEPTELVPLSQVVRSVAAWVDEINHADTEAKGCNGLTREAAFKYFSPPAEEIARRKPAQALIDEAFAERRVLRVRSGGVIAMPDGLRYDADRLPIGEDVAVRRFRRDPSQLFVDLPSGTVAARLRPEVGIYEPELLAQESARLARRRRLLKSDFEPSPAPSDPDPGKLETEHVSLPEISSVEWMMERRMTSSELARMAREAQETE